MECGGYGDWGVFSAPAKDDSHAIDMGVNQDIAALGDLPLLRILHHAQLVASREACVLLGIQ
eukprot:3305279-Lingulodinium_polyedra.AAC.1